MTIGQAAKYLGVSKDTLRRWEKRLEGAKAVRSPTNRRYYTQKQLDRLMEEKTQTRSFTVSPFGPKKHPLPYLLGIVGLLLGIVFSLLLLSFFT